MATAQAPQAPPAPRGIFVKRGRMPSLPRVIIYGPEGVGKTTLAVDAPNCVLMDLEKGSKNLEAARYVFHPEAKDDDAQITAASYTDVVTGIENLITAPHDFQTLAIDASERLEQLIWRHVMERDTKRSKKGDKFESIEDYSYGKGYQIALDEWRALAALLDRLHGSRKMGIILLGHTTVRTWKNPEGEDFDRYVFRIHDKAAGFLKEWADVVGFLSYETAVEAERDKRGRLIGRPKGLSTGRRVLHTERTAAYDAKSRIPLPDEVEITETNPWRPFAEAIAEGMAITPEKLVVQIRAECERIGDADLTAKVKAAVDEKPSLETLQRYLNSLRRRPPVESNP